MRGLRHASLLVLLGSVEIGCGFRGGVPSGRTVECTPGGAACPGGSTCQAALGRCIDDALVQAAAASVVNPQLAPAIGNLQAHFTLDFQVTGPLASVPTASAVSAAGPSFPVSCQPCTSDLACHCDFSPDPSAPPPDGPLSFEVTLLDAAGHTSGPSRVGQVIIDSVAPHLVAPPVAQLTPPAGVETLTTEAGNGAQLQVCFTVDEALVADPTVWAGSGASDAGLPFSIVFGYPVVNTYCYQVTLGAADVLPDGPLPAQAQVADLAGNTAVLSLGSSADGGPLWVVDRTPPAPPDVSSPQGLRYHRAPWGELPTIGTPHLAILSSGPAVSKPGTLIAFTSSDETAEIGRVVVGAGASVQLDLGVSNPPLVWVDEVDLAGNRLPGGPVEVHFVDWVMNLGLKVQGDVSVNPHDCYARTRAGPTLVEADDVTTSLDAQTGPTGMDGGATAVQGSASWRLRSTGAPGTLNEPIVYDPAHGRVLAIDANGNTDAFDGTDWSLLPSPNEPEAVSLYGLAFDRSRGRAVLFGGGDGDTNYTYCDTWEFGVNGWTKASACEAGSDGGSPPGIPVPRQEPCMSYDPLRRRTVLIGGLDVNSNVLQDVWEWDGAQWTPLVDGAFPSCEAMIFDEDLDGGPGFLAIDGSDDSTAVGRWDGQGYTWTHLLPPWNPDLALPEGLAQDPATRTVVETAQVFADDGGTFTVVLDWDGVSPQGWELAGVINNGDADTLPASPPMTLPGASFAVMETDTDTATWACQIKPFSCTPLHTEGLYTFPNEFLNPLAFDDLGNGVVTGLPVDGGVSADQTWLWSGEDWAPAPSGPSPRLGSGFGYLPGADVFVLFRGFLGNGQTALDLWTFDVVNGWHPRGTPPNLPQSDSNKWFMALVPDGGSAGLIAAGSGGPVVLLSAADGGISATVVAATSPQGVFGYDPARHRGIIADLNSNLWEAFAPEWNFQRVSSQAPEYPNVVFDALSQSLLLIAGNPLFGQTQFGAVVRWDGMNMESLPITDPENDGNPPPYFTLSTAYDPVTQRVRQLATDSTQTQTDTWDLEWADQHPGLVCQFRVGAAQAPEGTTLTGLQINGQAEASGPDGGAVAVELSLWSALGWQVAQTCAPGSCSSLSYQLADSTALSSRVADLNTLGVQVTPAVANGSGFAAVDVASLQATLSYQVP